MMTRHSNARQRTSVMKMISVSMIIALATFTANALPCSGDTPQECSCTYTFSNGVSISSSICCRSNEGCGCTLLYGENGSVIGVKARCIAQAPPPGQIG